MKFITALMISLTCGVSHAYYEMDAKVVERFIKHDEELNIFEQLARYVEYPLHQPFKIPSIKDEAEFVSRFDEVDKTEANRVQGFFSAGHMTLNITDNLPLNIYFKNC